MDVHRQKANRPIPAFTEKTSIFSVGLMMRAAHPRIHGEDSHIRGFIADMFGPSPHSRRRHSSQAGVVFQGRPIPAFTEKTPVPSVGNS